MLAAGHSVLYRCSLSFNLSFSPPNLRGRLADRHQTLPHVRWWPTFIKFGQKFGWPIPPKFGGLKTSKFRHDFAQLSHISASDSFSASDSLATLALYKFTYLLTYLLTYLIATILYNCSTSTPELYDPAQGSVVWSEGDSACLYGVQIINTWAACVAAATIRWTDVLCLKHCNQRAALGLVA